MLVSWHAKNWSAPGMNTQISKRQQFCKRNFGFEKITAVQVNWRNSYVAKKFVADQQKIH
jgi:hypothetical protein